MGRYICNTPISGLSTISCPPDLGAMKSIHLTKPEIVENIASMIREHKSFMGQDLMSPRTYNRIKDRIERDLFIMKRIDAGKLKVGARDRLEYGQFTRVELSQLYNEIIKIKPPAI